LDEKKLQLNFYETNNKQYLYDSHLHPEYLDQELLHEYDPVKSAWFSKFMSLVNESLKKYNVNKSMATVLGASTGRVVFDLAKFFQQVVGVDYCGKFLEVALQLQSKGHLEFTLETDKTKNLKLDISDNMNASNAVFKQMTWIPNEIPKSDLVLFTMIDRVTNELCKFIEINLFCIDYI
jgi:hypothetical protein